jgi:hypothetical protein
MSIKSGYVARWLAVVAGAVTVAAGVVAAQPAALAAPSASAERPIWYEGHPEAIPGSYIVKLADRTELDAGLAAEIAGQYGGNVRYTYAETLNGFAVETSAEQAKLLAADPRVDYVAQDLTVSVPDDVVDKPVTDTVGVRTDVFLQPNPPSWGLDRVDQRSLPLDLKYFYPSTASTARAYIIGTGIRYTHQEFGGRAVLGTDLVGGVTPPGFDCNGHSTHMAGTVGGSTVGLAKGVKLISVRVLSCTGSGSFSQVIGGVNWVTQDNLANPRPSVANLSLGGSYYQPLNDAVTASIAANVHYSVPSGSSNGDACSFSPGSTPRATTVASSDMNDNRASFSNFGPCIDLFAPGVSIYSAWATADNAYISISGSTATAHATGVAALWRHRFPADNADQVATALNANATPGVVVNPGAGSPNRLLFMGMIPV